MGRLGITEFMMLNTCLEISSGSELCQIKDVLQVIMSYIDISCPYITKNAVYELRLIYSELLSNAIIHGNNRDFSKNVHIFIQINTNTIWSKIIDEGNGFNYSTILKNECTQDLFSETGRGLKIVQSLTDLLKFNKKGNAVEFYKIIALQTRDSVQKESHYAYSSSR